MKSLNTLLEHPDLWRGQQAGPVRSSLKSGFTALDKSLHYGGWPLYSSTEFIGDQAGIGELSLLMPALAQLADGSRRIGWISPPWLPYAPALQSAGVDPQQCLVIHSRLLIEQLWACEQLLKSGACSAVLSWFSSQQLKDSQLRRLQLAASQGQSWHIHFRPTNTLQHSSPARLRLSLQARPNELDITIHKQPGGWGGQQLTLTRPETLYWQQRPCLQWPTLSVSRTRRKQQRPAAVGLVKTVIKPRPALGIH